MNYFFVLLVSAGLSLGLTPYVQRLAERLGLTDDPAETNRKIHQKITARAGGISLYVVFMLCAFTFVPGRPAAFGGLVIASTLVFLIGLWDDIHRLNPWLKLAVQLIAAIIATVIYGIGIDVISNPFSNQISLTKQTIEVLNTTLPIWSFTITIVWLVGMTNTVNFLDGLDGLATGVSAIAAFILFLVSMLPRINQPTTAMLAIILLGVCLGFLRHNFYPAKIFLGDSGAYFLGMTLGYLAVISGAKLATALLVLGIPVLDAVWSVIRRLATGRSPFQADRGHIHHMLLDSGLNQRQVVLIIYGLALSFGLVAVIGDGRIKIISLGIMMMIVFIGILSLSLTARRRKNRT